MIGVLLTFRVVSVSGEETVRAPRRVVIAYKKPSVTSESCQDHTRCEWNKLWVVCVTRYNEYEHGRTRSVTESVWRICEALTRDGSETEREERIR